MNQRQIGQNADFLSIALEEFENDNPEMAKEFIDDVRVNLVNANCTSLSNELSKAIDRHDAGAYDKSKKHTENVYAELMDRLEQ